MTVSFKNPPVVSQAPPLQVKLINDSPRVASGIQGSVEAEFTISRPVAGVRCFLRSQYGRNVKDCEPQWI